MTMILMAALVLGGLGLLFGLLLTLANKVFEVPSDPRRDAVRNCLPGANCGGCGYAGCDALADAIGMADAATLIIPYFREGGRLTLADGTLAGADIDMLSSVLFVHRRLGYPLEEAIRMASLYPAEAMGLTGTHGRLAPGHVADFILLEPELSIRSVFIDGAEQA